MSYLRPEERHSLLEVSQIVTEEGADAVSPRDVMQGACSIYKVVNLQMDELEATSPQSVQPGQKDADKWLEAAGRSE